MSDVAVVGAGPAGLATAIGAACAGLSCTVFDRALGPIDKACGEGVLPKGLIALERLQVLHLLDRADTAPIEAIAYVQADARAEARLPAPGGLGVRRTALSSALIKRASEVGVDLALGTSVSEYQRSDGVAELVTSRGSFRARYVVFADGLASPFRRKLGLDGAVAKHRRFGLRQHFALAPWSRAVEVHFSPEVEAYVTPVGVKRVGVAFLWQKDTMAEPSFASLLPRFPELQARLAGAAVDSVAKGMGPLARRARRLTGDGFALVGDAAGYIDAITGEGISLALVTAEALATCLPRAVSGGGDEAIAPYLACYRGEFRAYAQLTRPLLWLAARPRLRAAVVRRMAAWPGVYQTVLSRVLAPGSGSFS